ncbi:VRR-NUC domain-containing protein [uncultured Kushneria sp.]|uniref:VRR-NUC domain-containing protein n=1 Tax=uncultured Kushneria sp. TaxID=905033 RepID=UPI002637D33E|nr:VRR-NUC domain-containing protein [uncultured Kushneria sp.]
MTTTTQRKPAPARRNRVDHEGTEQTALIMWLYGEKQRQSVIGPAYACTYAVPNGGSRHRVEAAKFKRQGVRAGVSDLVIACARGGHHGLYLEFKATPPKHAATSEGQKEWLATVEEQGYCAVLARGLEEAKAVIREYMNMPATAVHGPRQSLAHGTEWRS